jgi:Domain of unknown function (DUF6950)
MKLVRRDNWQTILHNYLMTRLATPFRYGAFDCCLFVCDCIHAMTGVDPAERFRGKYETRCEALELINAETGRYSIRSIALKISAEYEMERVSPMLAHRGDACLVRRTGDWSLGIVALDGQTILAVTDSGLLRLSLHKAVIAFRV